MASSTPLTSLPVPVEILNLIFEHCDLASHLSLRRVCRCFKRAADTLITTASHLPLPNGGLESSSAFFGNEPCGLVLKEEWTEPHLISREGAITETLKNRMYAYRYPGYNKGIARECIRRRGRFTMMLEPNQDFEPERGWSVELVNRSSSCSRASCDNVLQTIRRYNTIYNTSYNTERDMLDEPVEDNDGVVLMDILHRVWGLLHQRPQVLVHVKMSHNEHSTESPSGGTDEYALIQTSKGKKYQLYERSGFIVD